MGGVRWFSVMKERDRETYLLPRRAESYDEVMAEAVRALERYPVPQRHLRIPLVDPNSCPEDAEELRRIVQTVPLFAAIYRAGMVAESMRAQAAARPD